MAIANGFTSGLRGITATTSMSEALSSPAKQACVHKRKAAVAKNLQWLTPKTLVQQFRLNHCNP
jgi:hypothetical protein